MKTIKARFNCGYWIWDCPVCNSGNRLQPPGMMAICGNCYSDKFAVKEAIVNGVIVRGYSKQKQDNAKREAWAKDEVYEISFPKNYKKIEDALRLRKEEHQSWEVGETIEDLIIENKTHPALEYIKDIEKVEPVSEEPAPIILADLDGKTLRRIN